MNKKHTDKLNQWKDKVKTSKERNYNFETVSGKNNDLLYYPSEISDNYMRKIRISWTISIYKGYTSKFI